MRYNKVIKNPIMEVHWAGWRSDTLALQNNGWQLAVEEDPMREMLRIALHHPAFDLYGIMPKFVKYQAVDGMELPPLSISWIAHNIYSQRILTTEQMDYTPFDARPQFIEMEATNIRDMRIFRPLNAIQEIVVESHDVDELLGKILSMQSPRQAELREKARLEQRRNENVYDLGQYREVYNPKTDIIAQVVSI